MQGIVGDEQWRAIPGLEGFYEVSDQGRVRSLGRWVTFIDGRKPRWIRPRILRPNQGNHGYWTVKLSRGGRSRPTLVHRLIMAAFVGPCPDGQEVAHDNGIRTDIRLANLRYDTRKGNLADRRRHGTHLEGEGVPVAKLTEKQVVAIRATARGRGVAARLAAEHVCSADNIYTIWAGESWRFLA